MKTRVVVFLCTLATTVSLGQVVHGLVSDRKTKEPLPYVHIGVAGKNMGVISREDGSFKIDLSEAAREDTLIFSMIGYESQFYSVRQVQERTDIKLTPVVYQSNEFVIFRDTRARPEIKMGRHTPTKAADGKSGIEDYGVGGEIGLKISPKGGKYFVNDARFHMQSHTVDSILFRINLYLVDENDMPAESVLQREIYATARKKMQWIVAELRDQNIVMEEDLIVTYELVRVWFAKGGENHMFFTSGEGYDEGGVYYRHSSQAAWTTDVSRGPAAMYLTLEEY